MKCVMICRSLNRAGDKLREVHETVDIYEGLETTTFFDICGGPGAFTQLILDEGPRVDRGFVT